MSTGWIVLIVVLVILVALIIGLYFLGKRAEKKQEEQNAQVEATAQNVTMLIIDKKKLRIKDSGLPEQVIAQTPFYAKLSKLPIVKAKVGPKVMSLICVIDSCKEGSQGKSQRTLHHKCSRIARKNRIRRWQKEEKGASCLGTAQAERTQCQQIRHIKKACPIRTSLFLCSLYAGCTRTSSRFSASVFPPT